MAFPYLQPALYMKIHVGENTPQGFIRSVDGFKPYIDATITFGSDWLSSDSLELLPRMNMIGLAQNHDGIPFAFRFDGIVAISREATTPTPSASSVAHKTTPFGSSTTSHSFSSGHESFQDMLRYSYVGHSRYTVTGNGILVECFVSRLTHIC
ncbi:hypothetical protein MGYG_08789 [Nannizzia gypsea CBS 118893]|uniref:Uncharacterized protein n=1 Tax=Arthroderma gypseum (strain ATCC MYA-4604 / CBS 118893) TaxID=535722 RepID=E4V702_ARTGP|nr:hypothetical protein MGYG_08789 [Nannizzia gypsea CBS 118893]EFQ96868.1 hypothetical protein MGYG_08789 [Nannizzia gypsea CBS 118893]